MIGVKSIVLDFKIFSKARKKPYLVKVQANRNYGICDIILPRNPVMPDKTYITSTKEDRKREKEMYESLKSIYDQKILNRKAIRNSILDKFQGRQLNDEVVVERLKNVLSDLLNDVEI